jgi:hypothetical protein
VLRRHRDATFDRFQYLIIDPNGIPETVSTVDNAMPYRIKLLITKLHKNFGKSYDRGLNIAAQFDPLLLHSLFATDPKMQSALVVDERLEFAFENSAVFQIQIEYTKL